MIPGYDNNQVLATDLKSLTTMKSVYKKPFTKTVWAVWIVVLVTLAAEQYLHVTKCEIALMKNIREYWIIYYTGWPDFLAVIWFGSSPLSRQQVGSLSQYSCVLPVELLKGGGGGGTGQEPSYIVLYKSFNIHWHIIVYFVFIFSVPRWTTGSDSLTGVKLSSSSHSWLQRYATIVGAH